MEDDDKEEFQVEVIRNTNTVPRNDIPMHTSIEQENVAIDVEDDDKENFQVEVIRNTNTNTVSSDAPRVVHRRYLKRHIHELKRQSWAAGDLPTLEEEGPEE